MTCGPSAVAVPTIRLYTPTTGSWLAAIAIEGGCAILRLSRRSSAYFTRSFDRVSGVFDGFPNAHRRKRPRPVRSAARDPARAAFVRPLRGEPTFPIRDHNSAA